MSNRTVTLLALLVGVICGFVIIKVLFADADSRTVRNDLVQGVLVGAGLAFVSAQIVARIKATKINGWTTIYGCGVPGKGKLFRAACAQVFPGPVNVPEEAMYWTTSGDGAGQMLNGRNQHVLRFPRGGLPPNDAFWSLTMGDARNRFVANPINRYSVSDRSGLVPNVDGSIDIYMQNALPAGRESNWLPAPAGNFIVWLRVYMPGPVILRGEYDVPPIIKQ
jgi:hypothetical protein